MSRMLDQSLVNFNVTRLNGIEFVKKGEGENGFTWTEFFRAIFG